MGLTIDQVKGFGVVGLGKMGGDWVAQFLEKGYPVIGFDSSEEARNSARERVLKALQWIEKKRKSPDKQPLYSEGFADEAIERFTIVDSLEAFMGKQSEYQIVLECIFEDMKPKQDLFVQLTAGLSENHIFWTNTSSLNVLEMARPAGIEKRLVGTHGMNPVYMMLAVEVVGTLMVEKWAVDLTLEVLKRLGKEPSKVADVSGFWVNKLFVPLALEAFRALERGEITVEDGDKCLHYSLGHPQGVFKLSDFIGADTMYRVAMAMYLDTQDSRLYPPAILTRMFKEGNLGQKTGQGFYRWDGMKPVGPVDFSDWQIKGTDTILG